VVVHAHNLEVIDELLKNLESIPGRFDLFLNFSYMPQGKKEAKYIQELKKNLTLNIPGKCYFSTSNNRGQDLGGLFASVEIAREKGLSYDLICKVHTKRDDDTYISQFGGTSRTKWRKDLYKTLLKNEKQVKKIISIFKLYPGIGLYSDKKYYCDLFGPENNSNDYRYFVKKLNLGLEHCWPKNQFFLAGTMFWFNGDIWEFLKQSDITIWDFELGATDDGSRAHAFERIFNAIVYHLGFSTYCE